VYAIIRTGGKQYRVQAGDVVRVERLEGAVGASVTLDDVLLVAGEGEPRVGSPRVEGVSVEGTVVEQEGATAEPAAAQAEAGQFTDAVVAEREALALAVSVGLTNQAATLSNRMGLYHRGLPYREP